MARFHASIVPMRIYPNLTLSDGTLTPAFSSANTSYTRNRPNATSSMTATPTAADLTATIQVQVNGGGSSTVPPGSPSGSLALNAGCRRSWLLVKSPGPG